MYVVLELPHTLALLPVQELHVLPEMFSLAGRLEDPRQFGFQWPVRVGTLLQQTLHQAVKLHTAHLLHICQGKALSIMCSFPGQNNSINKEASFIGLASIKTMLAIKK